MFHEQTSRHKKSCKPGSAENAPERSLIKVVLMKQSLLLVFGHVVNFMSPSTSVVRTSGSLDIRSVSCRVVRVELIQQTFDVWEDSQNAIGVFCDLSKTFYCIHHGILIRKLHYYGVTGSDSPGAHSSDILFLPENRLRTTNSLEIASGDEHLFSRSNARVFLKTTTKNLKSD
ncbi:hypothetical protein EVAR_90613_1 [Eumeta japonica]|uniref:Uncharacterized protein n=1 Tax=Eumeta variegata TaxID=151549 RepID=A0A4C1YQG3_EUMVA|nr:hypothetical protein EVAR_90613_1 [Eumeta japonica]